MIPLLICVALIVAGPLLFLLVQRLTIWRLSHTLRWPPNTPQARQARICQLFFARAGIPAVPMSGHAFAFDLLLHASNATLSLAFRGPNFPVTESFTRDFANESRGHHIPLIILHEAAATREALNLARTANTPALYPRHLPALRDLLKSAPPDLRPEIERLAP
jgi:hypothetical protein